MNGYDAWDKSRADYPAGMLEVITDVLYDTQKYQRGKTVDLTFFQTASDDHARSNMMYPSALPNPCSFLVAEISLIGIVPALADGEFTLTVGNKRFVRLPLRYFVVNARGSVILHERVFIGPLVYFKADIHFARVPKIYGPDLDIVVSMTGAMARPVA
jgi:hypothetical protein